MGETLRFSIATFSGTMSSAITSWCCASNTALERPTYPVPAMAIFMGGLTPDKCARRLTPGFPFENQSFELFWEWIAKRFWNATAVPFHDQQARSATFNRDSETYENRKLLQKA